MFIPIIAALLPTIVGFAEKLIPEPKKGNEKKDLVMKVIESLYDKFLQGVIPDLPGIDEKKIVLEILSHLVDFTSQKYFP